MFLLLFFASGEGILTQILQCYTMTLQRLLIIVDPDLCLASLVGVKDLKMGQLKFFDATHLRPGRDSSVGRALD